MKTITIEKTVDFDKFKQLHLNRPIINSHVANLVTALKDNPSITETAPIIVNAGMEVIDGQHRLEAHKKLAKEGRIFPIHYVVRDELTILDAKNMNSGNRVWTATDYARVEAERNWNYKVYMSCLENTKLPHKVICAYLGNPGIKPSSFRKGLFQVTDLKLAEQMFEWLEEIGAVIQKEGFGTAATWKNQNFGLAMLSLFKCKNYQQERMLEMIKERGDAIASSKTKISDLESTLKSIYNRGAIKKLRK